MLTEKFDSQLLLYPFFFYRSSIHSFFLFHLRDFFSKPRRKVFLLCNFSYASLNCLHTEWNLEAFDSIEFGFNLFRVWAWCFEWRQKWGDGVENGGREKDSWGWGMDQHRLEGGRFSVASTWRNLSTPLALKLQSLKTTRRTKDKRLKWTSHPLCFRLFLTISLLIDVNSLITETYVELFVFSTFISRRSHKSLAPNIFSKYFLSIIVSQSQTIVHVFKIALQAFEERWITREETCIHLLAASKFF